MVSYEVTAQDLSTGQVIRDSVPGSSVSHQIVGLSPHSTYNVSVRAMSDSNRYGETASQMFSISSRGGAAPSGASCQRKYQTQGIPN